MDSPHFAATRELGYKQPKRDDFHALPQLNRTERESKPEEREVPL